MAARSSRSYLIQRYITCVCQNFINHARSGSHGGSSAPSISAGLLYRHYDVPSPPFDIHANVPHLSLASAQVVALDPPRMVPRIYCWFQRFRHRIYHPEKRDRGVPPLHLSTLQYIVDCLRNCFL